MGAFFTNIQLKIVGDDKTQFKEQVIEQLINYNLDQGFVKIDDPEQADKTVIIAGDENSSWISVYDEDLEDQNSGKLNKLTSELSKHLTTIGLAVLVHDSELLYLGLRKNGALKDSISNLKKVVDFEKNKPAIWSQILETKYSFDDIKNAWKTKKLFVEDFLSEFSKFLGINSQRLMTGYNYMAEDEPQEGLKINFARKDKKPLPPLGPTKFQLLFAEGLRELKRGERTETNIMLTNHGNASTGLDVIVGGECIEQGFLKPETVKISHHKPGREGPKEYTATFLETVATTGEKIFYANFEDLNIPKGFNPNYPLSNKEIRHYMKVSYDSGIKFNLTFSGQKTGKGKLHIFFSPLTNRQEGYYCDSFKEGHVTE